MTARKWKRLRPTSLRQALELCKDHAREVRNLSVERIAEQMGVADHWTVYKWLQTGRIPAIMICAYETVCGIDYVTRWLAASSGKLIIDIPTGRTANAGDINTLQSVLNAAAGLLIDFYADKASAETTLTALQAAMQEMAWHKKNVEQYQQPELALS